MKLRAQIQSGLLVVAALAATAGAAHAENPATAHARAYGLDWIARAPDARFGDPAKRPVICLLDTGVAITPDTPADSPNGPIVARLSALGDDPLSGDANATLHGTRMAAAMAAPVNGWGTVGVWPGAQIVAVKVGAGDSVGIDADQTGISLCSQWASEHHRTVAAINLSQGLTGEVPPQAQLDLRESLTYASQLGASVVASAGNVPGRGTEWPASSPGVVAVGAGTSDASGWCSFASHDQLTSLVAPGCDVEAADDAGAVANWFGAGSSYATAVVSAVIGAMRSLRSDADRATVESWVLASGRILDGAHVLDGVQIAAAAGVSDLAAPLPPALTASVQLPAPTAAPTRAWVKLLDRRRLRVAADESKAGFKLQAAVRVHGRWRKASGKRTITIAGVPSPPARIWVRWRSIGTAASSDWTPLARPTRKPTKRVWRTTTRRGPTPPA